MPKTRSSFVCQQCGFESLRWFGKCPECGTWNSAVETVVSDEKTKKLKNLKTNSQPISLTSISSKSTARISTKISELDRVLGGGIVPGQVILIAGEPGIGKSTLLLQLANELSDVSGERSVLYISGEESTSQIAIRGQRLGISKKTIQLLEETDIDSAINTISSFKGPTPSGLSLRVEDLQAVVVDSIQTMATSDLSGMAGSVGQVRECAFRLVRLAKENNVPVFIVGHITKEGTVAGPAVLMHIVDTVLWFEGDKSLTLRLLRAVKNRFGPTDEVGIFSMEDKGLVPLDSPEKVFLSSERKNITGSATASVLQGSRPLLVEIQSLVVPTKMPYPKRVGQGIDSKRLELLIAVLIRRCGLPLYEQDVFVNVAGGITLKNDPSVDLATTLSIASAYFDKPLKQHAIAIGEIGLLGDIREVVAQGKRLGEAKRLGYKVSITNEQFLYLNKAIKDLFS